MGKRMCRVGVLSPSPSEKQASDKEKRLGTSSGASSLDPISRVLSTLPSRHRCHLQNSEGRHSLPRVFSGACGSWLLAASVLLVLQKEPLKRSGQPGVPRPFLCFLRPLQRPGQHGALRLLGLAVSRLTESTGTVTKKQRAS